MVVLTTVVNMAINKHCERNFILRLMDEKTVRIQQHRSYHFMYMYMVAENGEDRRSSTVVMWSKRVKPTWGAELHVVVVHARIERICGSGENR